MSEELLDFEVINEVNLRFPTFLLESTLTDVIVTGRARKGEVLGQQNVQRAPALLLPCLVPAPNNLLGRHVARRACERPCRGRNARRARKRTSPHREKIPARHSYCSHVRFSFVRLLPPDRVLLWRRSFPNRSST